MAKHQKPGYEPDHPIRLGPVTSVLLALALMALLGLANLWVFSILH